MTSIHYRPLELHPVVAPCTGRNRHVLRPFQGDRLHAHLAALRADSRTAYRSIVGVAVILVAPPTQVSQIPGQPGGAAKLDALFVRALDSLGILFHNYL